MSDLPPLTALRSFEAVARLGSISQAASELHVTHSAISQQIKLLENLLGLALFVREGRGLRLSENGRFYACRYAPRWARSPTPRGWCGRVHGRVSWWSR